MEPLISVIVPAYNSEKYIGRCIESILNQTYKNLEIIAVNDGSADRTGEILDRYASKHNSDAFQKITIIHKKNSGIAAARNKGLETAKGEYIGFVDNDDTIEKDMYEILIKNALKYDADVSHCGTKVVYPEKIDFCCNDTGKIFVQDNSQAIIHLFKHGHGMSPVWNKLYKAKLFTGIKFNENLKEGFDDLLINFYLFFNANVVIYIDAAKYNWFRIATSVSSKPTNIRILKEHHFVFVNILKQIEPFKKEMYYTVFSSYIHHLFRVLKFKENTLSDECKIFQKEIIQELKKHQNEICMTFFNLYIREIFSVLKLKECEISDECKIFQRKLKLELKENTKKIIKTKGLRTKYKIDTIGVSFIPFYLSARYYGTHCKNKRKRNKFYLHRIVDKILLKFNDYKYDKRKNRYAGTFLTKIHNYPGEITVHGKADNVIYCFWTGDNEMSAHRKSGLESMKANTGVKVELITPQKLGMYLKSDYPLHDAYHYLSLVHKSDYLRCYFMHHYGGGYSDIKYHCYSWEPLFDLINNSEKWITGYREVGKKGVAIAPGVLGKDLKHYWNILIGNCAYICKPHTPFTYDWYMELHQRLDVYYSDLKKYPGNVMGDNPGYPIPWTNILGNIFHPLCLKYSDKILYNDNVKPDFKKKYR
ncbi:MAG: glycosyltransferase [Chitinispirillales bacterium]|jgi:glycosyltransferase involved in cell wall biosynthesis|nr:glycosyltransferase [Chitinispirillales bacterium]